MNFYTTMMDSKDPNTGKPMFKVLKVGLACDACQAAGIASECTHMESFRPPWKSASKFAMVKQIYSTQKGMFERESMGKCLPFLQIFFISLCSPHTLCNPLQV